jgi:hypothetical protein
MSEPSTPPTPGEAPREECAACHHGRNEHPDGEPCSAMATENVTCACTGFFPQSAKRCEGTECRSCNSGLR